MDPLLLVVDDEPAVREIVTRCAQGNGYRVVGCADGGEALAFLEAHSADMALVDLRMPHVGGLEVLRAIRLKDPHCEVVLMSGAGTITDAVDAIKLGARDYLQKPFPVRTLQALLTDIRDVIERRRQALALEHRLISEFELCGMIGRSAVMGELFNLIRRLAPHAGTALVTGESGTGKDLVARALHALGPRSDRPFLALSCSGATEVTAEHDLFGHTDNAGALQRAAGGVLFFEEIGELPSGLQGRLLRFLEDGGVQRVGSFEARQVDVAVIAATRRDLKTEMLAGRFRRELFYRLSSVELRVPPLRERKEDIAYLSTRFAQEHAARAGKPISGLTAPAEALLQRRDWPGNVRELRNTIEHACLVAAGDLITERDLTQALKHRQ